LISIIDVGIGNCGSIQNAFDYLEVDAVRTCDPLTIRRSSMLILPGVGHYDAFMDKIAPIQGVLNDVVLNQKVPILGICLGSQIIGSGSEEGNKEGLGWLPFKVKRFSNSQVGKVPNMGWLIHSPGERYYYAHSYYIDNAYANIMDHCEIVSYGGKKFISNYNVGNIYATQFHPEKSGKCGLQFLKKLVGKLNV
jgi:imidazole glycerol-phosphate synthase subunit HisH